MTVDLRTTYLGLELAHPIVASAGPLAAHPDGVARLAAAGAAAIVLPSLFEEEVARELRDTPAHLAHGAAGSPEAQSYLPELAGPTRVEQAIALVAEAKQRVDVPVIASVNGTTLGGWVAYARDLADAGADAIELNVYLVAADADDTAAAVEARVLDVVRAVRADLPVPLAVKVSPYFSAMAHTAQSLAAAGADGIVLFNRFYQPDIDLETLDVATTISLSTSGDLQLPLRWVGILRGQVDVSLALSGGVHDVDDAVKAVLAGADVVMTTSGLLRRGAQRLGELRDGLAAWLAARDYESVRQACGSVARHAVADPDAYERAGYVQLLRAQLPHR